jgi:acetolactate synthase-1/3 small subunit
MRHTLVCIVQDKHGVLTRITGLCTRRGFNIDNLSVGHSEREGLSRVTLVVPANLEQINLLTSQIETLVNVISVGNVSSLPCVERELVLVKLNTATLDPSRLAQYMGTFDAHIVDSTSYTTTLQIAGDPGKIEVSLAQLEPYLIELARTGKTLLLREGKLNCESIRQSQGNVINTDNEINNSFHSRAQEQFKQPLINFKKDHGKNTW